MAKNRNAATIRAIKRRDNRAPILTCNVQTPKGVESCGCEFYAAQPGVPSKRYCYKHWIARSKPKYNTDLTKTLKLLGLLP